MTQKVPVIPAVTNDIPLNSRRILLAMKTNIEFLLTQTGITAPRFGATVAVSSGGTSAHNALNAIQGGVTDSYFHLTEAQHTDLTDSGNSTLHFHDTDRDLANHTGLLPWANVDKTGALLSDFDSLGHEDLSTFQGGDEGEHYHLTTEQWAFLTQGTDTTLHLHDSDRARANHTGTQNLTTVGDVTITATDLNTLDDGADSTLHFHDSDRDSANFTGTDWTDLTDAGVTALHKHDHGGQDGLGDNDHPQYLLVADIDDTPVNGEVAQPISSNWAFDHAAAADPHSQYALESALGDAAAKDTGTAAGTVAAGDDARFLSSGEKTDLTDAGATTLHKHDHGGQDGLGDDDHAQYLLADGTRALSGPLTLKSYTIAAGPDALPAAGTVGRVACVTDALAPTFLVTIVGGGAVKCPVFDNGANWIAF